MNTSQETPNLSTGAQKPPYGGYGTFRGFIDQMSELHSAGHFPQVIDRSVMGQRGGSARSELYIALRFFGLIDDDKQPTPLFADIAAAPSAQKLREIVTGAYAPLIEMNLNTATPSQVDAALKELGASPSTVGRARTFFLNAAQECDIEVGQMLRTAPRPPSTRRRARPKAKGENGGENDNPEPKLQLPPLIGALVAKLPAEADGWDEADAQQWLGLVAPAIAYDYKLDLTKLTPSSP